MAPRVTIVAVGVTGCGKSALGNAMAPSVRGRFRTSDAFGSATSQCSHTETEANGVIYRYIDTVGFFDTRMTHDMVYDKFAEFCDRAPDGVDVFLFLEQKGRFCDEQVKRFNLFKEYVGEEAMAHTILVLTHVSNNKLQEQLEREHNEGQTPAALVEVLNQVRAVVGAESKSDPSRTRQEILNRVGLLREANEGRTYTNRALKEARSRRDKLQEFVNTLTSDRRSYMDDALRDLLNGARSYDEVHHLISQAVAAERADNSEKQLQQEATLKAMEEARIRQLEAQEASDALNRLRLQHQSIKAEAELRVQENLQLRSALNSAEFQQQQLQQQVETDREKARRAQLELQQAEELAAMRSCACYVGGAFCIVLVFRWFLGGRR